MASDGVPGLSGLPQPDNSRMAELATELLGAKLAAEFVKEAWAFASEDAKRGIADALIRRMIMKINDKGHWDVDRAIESAMTHVIRTLVEAHHPEVIEEAKRVVGQRISTVVQRVIDGAVTRLTETVRGKITSAVTEAIRGLG